MSKPSLEDRLTKLEQQMATLVGGSAPVKAKVGSENGRRSLVSRNQWQQTLGTFGPEDGMDEVFEAAMQLREEDRKQARRPKSRKTATKKSAKQKLVRS